MNIKEVNPNEALHLAKSGTIFVDVREKLETDTAKYGVANIIYLPMSELEQTFSASLPADKNTQIVLACRGGGRSMRAAEFLQTKGYKNLLNLAGGILAWSTQGLPIQGTVESSSKDGCCATPTAVKEEPKKEEADSCCSKSKCC